MIQLDVVQGVCGLQELDDDDDTLKFREINISPTGGDPGQEEQLWFMLWSQTHARTNDSSVFTAPALFLLINR